jgi:predicted phage terminase large subunit-like protein
MAVGAGGPITGRGADLLVIDDPIKGPEDARSATGRRLQQEWFSQVARTRLMPGGKIVLVQTRWHEDDLAGWLLREHFQEGWKVLAFSAVAERDEGFRKEGDALWPERFSVDELNSLRRQLGVAAFAALYQQRPLPTEGLVFHRAWFPDYVERPPMTRVVQSWDPAFKKGTENSFSVCTTWGEGEDGYYLMHMFRDRVEFPELKRKVIELAAEFMPEAILIEDKASGQSLLQELQHESRLPILPIKVDSDRLARAQSVTPIVEAGKVKIPSSAPFRGDFLDEVTAFPYGGNDDIVDSMVQALRYLRDRQPRRGHFEALVAAFHTLGTPQRPSDPYSEANRVDLPEGYRPGPPRPGLLPLPFGRFPWGKR